MSRTPNCHQWAEEACLRLMVRRHIREPIFADDEDRGAFLGLVSRHEQRFAFRLYHYCLVPPASTRTPTRS
jgi:hypothetical protein